jgi:hypothetical protein
MLSACGNENRQLLGCAGSTGTTIDLNIRVPPLRQKLPANEAANLICRKPAGNSA